MCSTHLDSHFATNPLRWGGVYKQGVKLGWNGGWKIGLVSLVLSLPGYSSPIKVSIIWGAPEKWGLVYCVCPCCIAAAKAWSGYQYAYGVYSTLFFTGRQFEKRGFLFFSAVCRLEKEPLFFCFCAMFWRGGLVFPLWSGKVGLFWVCPCVSV